MIFQREGCKPLVNPSPQKLALELSRTKSSFANLTAPSGAYVQVAGGPGLFVLEHRDSNGQQFRAYQDKAVSAHPDGTLLQTSAGHIAMAKNDWFLLAQVSEAFTSFLSSSSWPDFLQWRALNV